MAIDSPATLPLVATRGNAQAEHVRHAGVALGCDAGSRSLSSRVAKSSRRLLIPSTSITTPSLEFWTWPRDRSVRQSVDKRAKSGCRTAPPRTIRYRHTSIEPATVAQARVVRGFHTRARRSFLLDFARWENEKLRNRLRNVGDGKVFRRSDRNDLRVSPQAPAVARSTRPTFAGVHQTRGCYARILRQHKSDPVTDTSHQGLEKEQRSPAEPTNESDVWHRMTLLDPATHVYEIF